MYHSQMISMERESSEEETGFSEERTESFKRILEKKSVWEGPEQAYYYGVSVYLFLPYPG